jgi:hypothetical protein
MGGPTRLYFGSIINQASYPPGLIENKNARKLCRLEEKAESKVVKYTQ